MVAVGASAGGLEAFRTLLAALPADSGMAFILVQHLDANHDSMVVELLSRHAAIPVIEATEAARIEPDHIYVIPPERFLAMRDGAIRLSRATGGAVRMPFDFLLQSLAAECRERAIGVVLSGAGADGGIGARSIKDAGGLVIAQEPREAEYDGMPHSAIATGAVDLVLPLAEIPQALMNYGRHRYVRAVADGAPPPMVESTGRIIALLRERTSHDFALYKESMFRRRLERRKALSGIDEDERYLALLISDPAELQNLVDDLLINVTSFFRDRGAFAQLAETIVPELVRNHQTDQPIRVWVAGCSTGEEAYSVAMLLIEEIAKAPRNVDLQVFATDVDASAIVFARDGLYPQAIEADVSPARLRRFFTPVDRGFRVSSELRASVVFSVHDLVADPPFSRLDLISCRNLLIYLRPEAQQKVISTFHFALAPGSYLFLGASETIGAAVGRFERIAKTQQIYRHVGRGGPRGGALAPGRREAAQLSWTAAARLAERPRTGVGDLAQRLLLEAHAPASVLVDQDRQTLYSFGPTDLYLRMPSGESSLDLLASAREGLRSTIRAAIEMAIQTEERADLAGRVNRNGETVAVTVSARPVTSAGRQLVLLGFADMQKGNPQADVAEPPATEIPLITNVAEELEATREALRIAVRDRETAEDEIRAINEEAMSMSEQFQTTNEELEASRQELRSMNEELMVLNSQLHDSNDRYRSIAKDFESVFNSSDMASIFLDLNLNIRFFTTVTASLFNVIPSDVGRPLADITYRFDNPYLLHDVQAVASNLEPVAREVQADDERWYNCRTLPFRTRDGRIEGVLITLADVTIPKRAEDAANAASVQAQSANLTKSRFLAAASHDLRQPLQTLSLLQGLLATKLEDKDALQLVSRSHEALTAMAGMLNTLLDINQLDAGIVRPEIVSFPINELLERLKLEFAYHAEVRGLTWRVVPSRLVVNSDPRLLDQMIRNLLSNALKYTSEGGVLLGCRRHGDRMRIEVWDTGIGIAKEQFTAIFDEFHQIDNPSRELGPGLGLGLAIVQRLGSLLDISVDVRSREDKGSSFAIEVPLAPAGALLTERSISQEAIFPIGARGSILILEDDPTVREALQMFLRSGGHLTATAADGAAALQIVEDGFRPDVIVVDYNLPGGLNGLEVVTRLREALGFDAPTLVLTGDISTRALREIAAQGHEQRSKPVSAGDFARLIQRLLPATTEAKREPVIYVIDDDSAVRDAISDLLKASGRMAEAYPSGEAFIAALRPDMEGCLLVDAVMPGMDGFALLDRLKAEGVLLPAIMVTGDGDVHTAVRAIRAGAVDFMEKPIALSELLASIDHALEEARDSTKLAASRAAAATRIAGLTARQRQILQMVLDGQPSKLIAADLGISQRTVEAHRAAIMRKTGSKSLTALVRSSLIAS